MRTFLLINFSVCDLIVLCASPPVRPQVLSGHKEQIHPCVIAPYSPAVHLLSSLHPSLEPSKREDPCLKLSLGGAGGGGARGGRGGPQS